MSHSGICLKDLLPPGSINPGKTMLVSTDSHLDGQQSFKTITNQ